MKISRRSFVSALLCLRPRAGRASIRRERDRRTEREVWQITEGDAISHSCYFEAQPFTDDDRFLVYCSNRSGAWQLYAVELATGLSRQLTEARDLANMSFSIPPGAGEVVYLDGSRLWATGVESGKRRLIIDLAEAVPGAGGFAAGRTFSRDGVYTPVSYTIAGETFIGRVNLRAGRLEESARIPGGTGGHLLVCPSDPYLVTFVRTPDEQNDMSLPMERRARTMIVDLRTGSVRPFLIMPYGWRATHEYWDATGERFYFHKKKVPGWVPTSICSMKRDGTDRRTHFASENLMLGHSMISPDGRFIVSDVQKPGDNPLVYIDLETGWCELLCWPDSSVTGGHARQAHVHPSISRSGKYVAFTSDRTGVPQVYVVPL